MENESAVCDVETVIITGDLDRRASRAPDYEAENQALVSLAEAMSIDPGTVLQRLVELTIDLTHCDSAGISLLEPGGEQGTFRWVATAGAWSPYRDGTMPREQSPCGQVIARETVLLVKQPERAFPALLQAQPSIGKGLLAPFSIDGAPAGTVWAIMHGPERRFEAEDARLLKSLARLASAAHQMTSALTGARASEQKLEARYQTLFDSIDEGFVEMEMTMDDAGQVIDWRWIDFNPAFERMSGLKSRKGQFFSEIVPELEPEWAERYGHVIATGEALRFELPVGGLDSWFDAFVSRIGGEGSRRLIVVFNNITARKHAEKALRESEGRQAFLLKLSDELRSLDDAGAIKSAATRAIGEHLAVDRAMYGDIDEGTDEMCIGALYCRPGVFPIPLRFPVEGFGPAAARLREGQLLDIPDAHHAPDQPQSVREAFLTMEIGATLAVPLIKAGRWVSTIGLHSTRTRAWTDSDATLLRETGERTWAAVERAQAESRLRDSEARLAAAFESVPVGLAAIDLSGKAILANAEYRRFLPSEIIPSLDPLGVTRWRAWDAEGRPLDPHEFPSARALRGETVVPGEEMLYMAGDGQEIWTTVATAPVRDAAGGVVGAVTAISDIDLAKRSNEALRESEERFHQFGEASQDVLWVRDAETFQWEYLTSAFETIYGLDRQQALAGDNMASWVELIVPEDRTYAIASLERVRDGDWVTFEYRVRRPVDGDIRWLLNTDFPIQDATGKVVRMGGIGHDITELKRTEEALAAAEVRQRTLMEGIPQLVWRSCDKGEWTWASSQWLDFTGQTQEQSHGRGWLDVIHPDDRAATMRAWDEARPHGMLDVEYRVRHAADGRWVWHHTRSVPVRDDDGRIVEWLGTSTDIQNLRELQDRQQVLVTELQHRTFNLMGVVRSMADSTLRSSDSLDEFKAKFRDRVEALARAQRLLSRLKEGDRVTFDELIRGELTAAGALQQEGRVTLEGPDGISLRSSTVQTFAMAVHELTTNALKYGALKQAGAHLDVRWHVQAGTDDRPWLRVDWVETGVAMPPAGAKPIGTGQGRTLIEEALPYQLQARTTYVMAEDGIRCSISLPVSHRTQSAKEDTIA